MHNVRSPVNLKLRRLVNPLLALVRKNDAPTLDQAAYSAQFAHPLGQRPRTFIYNSRSGGTSVLGCLDDELLRPAGVRSAALLPSPPSLFAAAAAAARTAEEPRPVRYEPHVLAAGAADPPAAAPTPAWHHNLPNQRHEQLFTSSGHN